MSLSVDSAGSLLAIKGQSSVTLDARGSSGTGLRFSLDFGDGQGAEEAVATHVYQTAGRIFKSRVIVTDSLGRTDTATMNVGVASLEGTWSNGFFNQRAKRYEQRYLMVTAQTAKTLVGEYQHPEGTDTPIVGELIGERGASLQSPDGFISFVTEPVGGINSDTTKLSVKVRGGSADGLTLDFSRAAPTFFPLLTASHR